MRKGYGVMIIEVKDWDLGLYELDDKKHWILKQNRAVLKSPIQQVIKYKENLFELHIDTLLENFLAMCQYVTQKGSPCI